MTTATWGIIGAGDVAEKKSGPAFNKIEESVLQAVMRRTASRAKDFAERHGVNEWFDNVGNLIACKYINCVYIATPPSSHLEIAKLSLKEGKNVYLEKPMCLNASECRELTTFAATCKGKLSIAHYRRHLPCFLKVKELIEGGAIGEVSMAQIRFFVPKNDNSIIADKDNWRKNPTISGSGLFHDVAPHHIDMMLYLFGPTDSVSGEAHSSPESPVHDCVSGRIHFRSGVTFTGIWNFSVSGDSKEDICEIHGSKGKISFSFFGEELSVSTLGNNEKFCFTNPENVQLPMIAEVVKYFTGKSDVNPCTAEEGTQCVEILDCFTIPSSK